MEVWKVRNMNVGGIGPNWRFIEVVPVVPNKAHVVRGGLTETRLTVYGGVTRSRRRTHEIRKRWGQTKCVSYFMFWGQQIIPALEK